MEHLAVAEPQDDVGLFVTNPLDLVVELLNPLEAHLEKLVTFVQTESGLLRLTQVQDCFEEYHGAEGELKGNDRVTLSLVLGCVARLSLEGEHFTWFGSLFLLFNGHKHCNRWVNQSLTVLELVKFKYEVEGAHD